MNLLCHEIITTLKAILAWPWCYIIYVSFSLRLTQHSSQLCTRQRRILESRKIVFKSLPRWIFVRKIGKTFKSELKVDAQQILLKSKNRWSGLKERKLSNRYIFIRVLVQKFKLLLFFGRVRLPKLARLSNRQWQPCACGKIF